MSFIPSTKERPITFYKWKDYFFLFIHLYSCIINKFLVYIKIKEILFNFIYYLNFKNYLYNELQTLFIN